MLVAAGWLLAGCTTISSMNPVNWWHRQEGGAIAQQRPAPPGADQPYPNIASVPAKPTPPNAEEMKKLTDSLVADRTNAQHEAEAAPLADPSSPSASPGLFGIGSAPPPPPPGAMPAGAAPPAKPGSPAASGTPAMSASIPAVNAPVAPPSPAPRKSVQSAPLAPLPATASPSAASPSAAAPARTASAGSPPAAQTAAAAPVGPPPALPAAPPPRPAVAGPPPAPVPVSKPMPTPSGGTSATIVFLDKASDLSAPAANEVKAFAAKRGKGTISVIGYGDSTSSDPDAQSAAVNLGLSRAQSIVTVLRAAGVPDTAIRVSAEASGRGAALQVLQ
jgi:outer membrane protein OmpA-like peptidoglycan-associated protein